MGQDKDREITYSYCHRQNRLCLGKIHLILIKKKCTASYNRVGW